MTGTTQKDKIYALLKEVYGPLENLTQKDWGQIERGVKALTAQYGKDITLESIKAMKHNHDKTPSNNTPLFSDI